MEEPDSDFGFILQTSDSDFGFRLQISDFRFRFQTVSTILTHQTEQREQLKPNITTACPNQPPG